MNNTTNEQASGHRRSPVASCYCILIQLPQREPQYSSLKTPQLRSVGIQQLTIYPSDTTDVQSDPLLTVVCCWFHFRWWWLRQAATRCWRRCWRDAVTRATDFAHSSLCCNHCAENPPLVVCFTNAIPARFAFQEVIFSSQITRFFKLSHKGVRHSNPARKIGDRSHSLIHTMLALREFCLPPVHGRNNTDIFTYNITLFLPIFFFFFPYFATGGRQLSDDYGDDTMTIATTTLVRFTPSIATRFSCARCVCLCYCLPTEKN